MWLHATTLTPPPTRPRLCLNNNAWHQARHIRCTALQPLPQLDAPLDQQLSRRPLQLDPCGYFLVLLDREAQEIVVEWYTNTIDRNGMWACW